MQDLPFALLERCFHPDLRIRRHQSAEPPHINRFLRRSFRLAITMSPVSPLLQNTASNTRILGRGQFPSRRHTPTNLLSGQATWLRCRVLDEPLAAPWCRNLACTTVMWRSRPDLRSSLWMVAQCLLSARLPCGSLRIECRHSGNVPSFLRGLALPEFQGCN
jgi:hypothetical protein